MNQIGQVGPGRRPATYGRSKSVTFDGVDEYATADGVATSGILDWQDSAHTVCVWIKTTQAARTYVWSAGESATINFWSAVSIETDKVTFWGIGGTGLIVTPGSPVAGAGFFQVRASDPAGINPADGSWHHIALTVSGTASTEAGVNGYLDGAAAGYGATGSAVATPDQFTIAALRRTTSQGYVDGPVADLQIYDRALDSSEIAYLATAPMLDAVRLRPTHWFWMGDRDTFPTLRDHGTGASDATIVNGLAGDIADGSPS